jgi:Zn-finger nucleic acid-binding protein
MKCPRCNVDLVIEHHRGIQVDHCPSCNGRWLDHHELDELEATVPSTPEQRRATIRYAKRESELACPKCGKTMSAFNYRAYNLELDTCDDKHGFWLDAGEEGRVRDIIEERIRGLSRAASAEAAWDGFLDRLKAGGRGGSVWDQVTGFFRRRR